MLKVPLRVADAGRPPQAAQELIDTATDDAKQLAEEVDAKETEDLQGGARRGGRRPDAARYGGGDEGAGGQAEAPQDAYAARQPDLALTELTGFYRDVLALQLGSKLAIANVDVQDSSTGSPSLDARADPAQDRVGDRSPGGDGPECGALLAVEAMTMALRAG